ncbi:MAG: EamA family transporter [Clostridia bacterium]|nr:EamA family transporter [Clostridia bacterium]
MLYLLLFLSILFAVLNNILYHKLSELGKYDNFFFTAMSSFVWLAVLAPLADFGALNKAELIFGIIYGTVQAMFLFFKMKAMSTGPVSVTSVVSNCSMVLTTLMGIIIFSEKVTLLQIAGSALILLSVFLCVDPKSDMKMTLKWKIYCVFFFVFAAAVGIIFKLFSAYEASGANMMSVAAISMVICLSLLSFAIEKKPKPKRIHILFAVLCGILSCFYNRINVFLSGALPSVVFFPIFNGSIVLFSSISGALIFKEQLSKKQYFGILTGILAIIILALK